MNGLAIRAWQKLPAPAKGAAKRAWSGYALITSRGRLLPDFLIIGTQRGGTTSLYKYLVQHPNMPHALTKELRFFDRNYDRGMAWYRSRFPSRRYREGVRRRRGVDLVVGEASPDYVFNPHAPSRVAEALPDAKLIVMLRNPVDRAYSHYWHQVKRGHETLTFEQAVEQEPGRLEGELERVLADERYDSYELHHHSYLARGRYAEQLEGWMGRFDPEQLLIERSEDFFADPPLVYQRVLEFLGLADWELERYEAFNAHSEDAMSPATRATLIEYFRPHNRRLEAMLGRELGWDV